MTICNSLEMCIFISSHISFSSGFERKIVSTVLIKFRDKGKHLGALFNKMESRKLGKLKVFPAVGDCGKRQTEWNGTG